MFALVIVLISFNAGEVTMPEAPPVNLYPTKEQCDAARSKSLEYARLHLPAKRPNDLEPISFCVPAWLGSGTTVPSHQESPTFGAIIMFVSLTHPHAKLIENALVFKTESACRLFTAAVIKDPSLLKDNVKMPSESEYTIAAECVHLKPAGD